MDKDLGVGSSKDRPSRSYLGRVPRNRPKTKTLRKVLYWGRAPRRRTKQGCSLSWKLASASSHSELWSMVAPWG